MRADLGIGTVRYPELDVVTTVSERGMGPAQVLRARCEAGIGRRGMRDSALVRERLDEELGVIDRLGYPSYFLTVADVVELIKGLRVRAAARGSGAGSLVTYLLGISDVDPIRYGLLMERFLSPLRHQLPDVDIDVESARRMEVYDAVIDRFGGAPGQLHLDDGHLPGPARHPRRRSCPGPATGRDRRGGQGIPAHPGQPGARRAAGPAGTTGQPDGIAARWWHR